MTAIPVGHGLLPCPTVGTIRTEVATGVLGPSAPIIAVAVRFVSARIGARGQLTAPEPAAVTEVPPLDVAQQQLDRLVLHGLQLWVGLGVHTPQQ